MMRNGEYNNAMDVTRIWIHEFGRVISDRFFNISGMLTVPYIYICIYIYIYMYVSIYAYIYLYIHESKSYYYILLNLHKILLLYQNWMCMMVY
jgi:hypothetical protein